ncbi:MAG TPA: AmmeMemoRadiSam system protein B [Casimicrobiaceae bacterium]|nr:AmmeMemoRadiSam system protein B [Casimicrobiaceae bacterium]
MQSIRPAAVAGMFYPGTPAVLGAAVRAYLAEAQSPAAPAAAQPKALLVPHAGYVYSGPVAAAAYRRVAPGRSTIRRVVLLGPVHRVPVRGLALPAAGAFATPLGTVDIDADAVAQALEMPQVRVHEAAHAQEHSLEVQLPFLQTLLDDFRIVPFAVGDANAAEVAAVIERLWGGPETLIVVSSDLSHYHSYAAAQQCDRGTAAAILALDPSLDHEQACGATPINGFNLCAQRRGLKAELIDLRNSGDTAGDKARVVGYAAFAFTEPRAAPQAVAEKALAEATDAR